MFPNKLYIFFEMLRQVLQAEYGKNEQYQQILTFMIQQDISFSNCGPGQVIQIWKEDKITLPLNVIQYFVTSDF